MPLGARVAVIGTGYLGATHAACMAELGFEVLGLDVDADKVALLSKGQVPFYEPGLDELLDKHLESGKVRFTTSYAEVGAFADVHFICVGTPQRTDGLGADVTYVDAAVTALAPHLRAGALVVGKSTVPVGTAQRLAASLAELAADGAELAWNPEFLREGYAIEDTLRPDRLVFGVCTDRAERTLRDVYDAMIAKGTPVVVTDYATAEMVKVAANAFLATKISFINAMSEICEASGADVLQLAEALGHDERIGRRFLHAGVGFGGGCLPKDIRAFIARAGELGASEALTFLHEVDAINMRRRTRVVQLGREMVGGSLLGARVGVLGAAFKPNSDDIRDSPALNVAGQMQLQGAAVAVYDPKAMANGAKMFPTLRYATSAEEACQGADLVLHLTEWPEFGEIDPVDLARKVSVPRIIDGRNCLDAAAWRAAGWTYRGLGRP